MSVARSDSEFVVTTPQVLDERVTTDHRRRRSVRPPAAHRSEPCLQSAVIPFDAIVGVLRRVMGDIGQQLVDHAQ